MTVPCDNCLNVLREDTTTREEKFAHLPIIRLQSDIRKYTVYTYSLEMELPEEELSEELDRAIALSLQDAFDRELQKSGGKGTENSQKEDDDLVIVGESKAGDVTSNDHTLAVLLQENFSRISGNDDSSRGLALSLQQENEVQESEATTSPELLKRRYDPMFIVNSFWEKTDPTPNVHSLFVDFDTMFFQQRLTNAGVAVSWGPRMTLSVYYCLRSVMYST